MASVHDSDNDATFGKQLTVYKGEQASRPRPTPACGGGAAMTDPTRRQIMQMADEVGITDYDAAARLVQLALAVFSPAPVFVPVAEGLPGPKDCDAEGRCWWFTPQSWPCLYLLKLDSCGVEVATHWLPFHSLPLPAGEGE